MRSPIGLASALALAPMAQAQGLCLPSDLQGAWYAYAIGDSFAIGSLPPPPGQGSWQRCSIRFNADGRVMFGSSCFDDLGTTSTVAGDLTVRPGCRILGSITRNVEGASIRCEIDASLAPDKQTGAGVGACESGEIFLLNIVKG